MLKAFRSESFVLSPEIRILQSWNGWGWEVVQFHGQGHLLLGQDLALDTARDREPQ